MALSYDQKFISISEYLTGKIYFVDTNLEIEKMVFLTLSFGNEKNILNQVIINGENLILYTAFEYFIIDF